MAPGMLKFATIQKGRMIRCYALHPEKDFQKNTHCGSQGFLFIYLSFLVSIKSLALTMHPSDSAKPGLERQQDIKQKPIFSSSRKEKWEGERGSGQRGNCM